VNPITLETTFSGIFAGGDAVLGPATLIEAILAGKNAATSIDNYLNGLALEAISVAEKVVGT
jgi:heterodisulfide reductase subunit A